MSNLNVYGRIGVLIHIVFIVMGAFGFWGNLLGGSSLRVEDAFSVGFGIACAQVVMVGIGWGVTGQINPLKCTKTDLN